MPIPPVTPVDITSDYSFQASKEILQAKYTDTLAWAQWAGSMLSTDLVSLTQTLGSDTVEADIAALTAEIGTVIDFIPSTVISPSGVFNDSTLSALKTRLESDITTASTGLGNAESMLFARETTRQNTARTAAYNEITTQFSSRGFDMPPGALLAKQTEINNESALRLSDSSSQIMSESARLAADYNKHVLSISMGLLDILSRLFDSKTMRDFEASKEQAILAVESYKSTLGLVSTKADIILKKGELALTAKARQMALEVSTLAGLAQNASQMIAASLNGVSVSSSFGWSAGASNSSATYEDMNATRLADVHTTKAL
jgi:hypothetical protein